MHSAFYARDGETLLPTALTRGPWDNRFQHGGPPAALLTGAMARWGEGADWHLARVSLELMRPVPIAPLTLKVAPEHLGRRVQRLQASLWWEDKLVVAARGLRIRHAPLALPPRDEGLTWSDPGRRPRFVFPFFQHEVGYHTAVELVLDAGEWGRTPVAFWARPRVPLIEGEPSSAMERLMILADAQSGMGVPLDPSRYAFVNPDLTVYFERPPEGAWFRFDIRSTASALGSGLAQSEVQDEAGVVARSAQSLVVTQR
ncbi:MAG: thioesterase family protein [Alphaproteobacteria bacterium]|nr:thioesterase family protein [Alphaproteobacteria bacterium]